MKVLYVTTISATMEFFPAHIQMLQEQGDEVELACNLSVPLPETVSLLNCVAHHIPFSRSPVSKNNVQAYKVLANLLREENYDVVHTHTPNASAIVRLACRKLRKKGLKVFYTAHGFHFYKGAPVKNWLLYFPVEWLLSHVTDVLITMNREDYARAQKLGAKKVCYVPGVGIDFSKFDFEFSEEDRRAKRAEIGVPENAKLLVSVGELNRNKNHEIILRALAKIGDPNIHYCIAGEGILREHLAALADQLEIGAQVHLLGYRTDVAQIYKASDIFCFPSFREGLPVSVLEAMTCVLPVICSDIRGSRDLIQHDQGGFLYRPKDQAGFEEAIRLLLKQPEIRERMGCINRERVQGFGIERVLDEMKRIYCLDVPVSRATSQTITKTMQL